MALAFEFEASRDVYVYIVNEDEQGRSYALFPTSNTLQNPLAGGVTHGAGWPRWEVDSTGGQEHLFVIKPNARARDRRGGRGPAAGDRRSAVRRKPRHQHPRHRLASARLRDRRGPPMAPASDAAPPRAPQAEGLWVRELILKNP